MIAHVVIVTDIDGRFAIIRVDDPEDHRAVPVQEDEAVEIATME